MSGIATHSERGKEGDLRNLGAPFDLAQGMLCAPSIKLRTCLAGGISESEALTFQLICASRASGFGTL